MKVRLAYANGHWIGWIDLDGKVGFSSFGKKPRIVVEELRKATHAGQCIEPAYPYEIPEEIFTRLPR